MGHPVARVYTASFAIAGIGPALYMIADGVGARPDAFITTLLVTGTLGTAFFTVAILTSLRWMLAPALCWLAIHMFYLNQTVVVPADLLFLSIAFALFLALPGVVLIAKAPK